MSRTIQANLLVYLNSVPWVLATILLATVSCAVAAPEVRPDLPPPGVYDYRTLGSGHTEELFFGVPKEMELFGDPEKLKSLCVHFGGVSIDWSGKDIVGRDANHMVQLKQQFSTYFGRESQFPEDRCRAITEARNLPDVAVPSQLTYPLDKIKDNRLLIRFKDNGSRWVSLLSITQFVQCITENYRQGSEEETTPVPHCDMGSPKSDQSGVDPAGDSAQEKKGAPSTGRSPFFSMFFKFCKSCGVDSPSQSTDKAPPKIEAKSTDEGKEDQNSRSFFARAFLPDQRKPDYFLSRAFLAPQNLCGIHIKHTDNLTDEAENAENRKRAERCQVPELIRVGLVEGRVGQMTISPNLSQSAFPVAFFKPIFRTDKEYVEDRKEEAKIRAKGLKCDEIISPKYASTAPGIPSKLCQMLRLLQEEEPVTRLKLDQALMKVSDLPGITVAGVLEPTTEDPTQMGKTNLSLEPKFQRWDWATGGDNYGSDFMGPKIFWHRLGLNYFLTPGDTISWLYVRTPNENQLSYNQVDYRLPIGNEGFYGRLNLVIDQAILGGTIQKLNVKTKGKSGELALGYTSQVDRYMKRSIELGIHSTNIKTTLLDHDLTHDFVTEGFLKMDVNHKRHIKELGTQPKDRIDQLPGLEEFSITLKGSQGIKWNNNYILEGDLKTSRAEAGPEFFLLKANLKGLREFRRITRTGDLYDTEHFINYFLNKTTTRMYISGALEGQWSSEPLLSPKEMSFGGRKYGSAYEAGKIAGDHAWAIKGEVGYKFLDAFEADIKTKSGIPLVRNLEYSPFIFTEFAQVWNLDAQNELKGTQNDEILTGGVGARFNFQPNFLKQREEEDPSNAVIPIHQISVEMLWGWPLGGSPIADTAHSPEFRLGVMLQLFIPELGQKEPFN